MTDILSYRFGSLNMIPDVTPNGVFYLPPTGWLTSFYNPPIFMGCEFFCFSYVRITINLEEK
ncbi:hypothetical protein DN433_10545 [Lactobacillus reuteri]|nr:hypothetical protein [Limosilactobacillus reuteri]MQB99901.1 hypothetical protein [Limosilactobacillus reuteri]